MIIRKRRKDNVVQRYHVKRKRIVSRENLEPIPAVDPRMMEIYHNAEIVIPEWIHRREQESQNRAFVKQQLRELRKLPFKEWKLKRAEIAEQEHGN